MRGGGGCGVFINEYSCTWSPNKLWRSNSICNLWVKCTKKAFSCSRYLYLFLELCSSFRTASSQGRWWRLLTATPSWSRRAKPSRKFSSLPSGQALLCGGFPDSWHFVTNADLDHRIWILGSVPSKRVMSAPLEHKTIFFSEFRVGDLMLYVATKFN